MYGLLREGKIWPRYNYLKIWNLRVQKKIIIILRKSPLKFLAMRITNQKLSFDMVGNLLNISMEHDLYLIS